MRFIMTCMVIVGLCLLALPLVPVFNGIQEERAQILAEADANINLAVPPPVIDQETQFAQDNDAAAALAGIEPAAGDDMVTTPDTFTGGFSGDMHDGFADPAPAETE